MSDIVERAKAVIGPHLTPEPWVVNTEGWAVISSGSDSVMHAYVDTTCVDCGEEMCQSMDCHVAASIEDLEFIAAARTLVPELVAEVEKWKAAAVYAQARIERIRDVASYFCIPNELAAAMED